MSIWENRGPGRESLGTSALVRSPSTQTTSYRPEDERFERIRQNRRSGSGSGFFGSGPGANSGTINRAPMAEVHDYINTNFPGMAAFFNAVPEIRDILVDAAKNNLSPLIVQQKIQATNWWKARSASVRDWELLLNNDPAEARARVQTSAASIQNIARSLGLSMSAGQIAAMATEVTRNGWSDEQTIDRLLQGLNWSTVEGGDLTAMRDEVKSIGARYLTAVSDTTAQQYAARIASGELTMAGVTSIMQRQARSRFSWMADIIDQGVTPEDYFAPVRDTIARTLEMAPEAVNLMDSQWLSMVETRDPKTGEMRAATLHEADLAARRRPEYWDTNRAQEQAAWTVSALREMFGR
jgi:hypothetical protein